MRKQLISNDKLLSTSGSFSFHDLDWLSISSVHVSKVAGLAAWKWGWICPTMANSWLNFHNWQRHINMQLQKGNMHIVQMCQIRTCLSAIMRMWEILQKLICNPSLLCIVSVRYIIWCFFIIDIIFIINSCTLYLCMVVLIWYDTELKTGSISWLNHYKQS